MDLEDAEYLLETEVYTWRTDLLYLLSGKLVNIASYLLPAPAKAAYNRLWQGPELTQVESTELLKSITRKVLAQRSYSEYVGKCPACGKDGARIVRYDGGRYFRIAHPGEVSSDFRDGKAPKLTRHCYAGPNPPATRYEGDL